MYSKKRDPFTFLTSGLVHPCHLDESKPSFRVKWPGGAMGLFGHFFSRLSFVFFLFRRGVLLIWIRVGQGHTALTEGAGGVVWTFFLSSIISLLSPSLWETARYRLKYCLKGTLSPNNQSFSLSLGYRLKVTEILSQTAVKPKQPIFLFLSGI